MLDHKTIRHVIAIYVVEHKMHAYMPTYLFATVMQRSADDLIGMSKDELWGLLDLYAINLQEDIKAVGGLERKEFATFVRST